MTGSDWIDTQIVDNLLADGAYIDGALGLVIQQKGGAKQVLLILGDRYTLLETEAFRALATRLLNEL